MNEIPKVIVVYDSGSLSPTRLAEAAKAVGCRLVFTVADSQHGRDMLPVLKLYGDVVQMAAPTDRSAAVLAALLRPHQADGIVTFSEFQIATTAELADILGLPYLAVEDLPAITRKDLQRQVLEAAGVDSVRYRAVTSFEDTAEAVEYVGFPAIIKPVLGASSRNTAVVRTERECSHQVTRALQGTPGSAPAETALMIEEYLVGRTIEAPWGDYIAVDCVVSDGRVSPMFMTSKFTLAEPCRERGGYGAIPMIAEAEAVRVRELACDAVRSLNICQGIADVEMKLTADGPRVIEVNGRLGAWVDDLGVRSGTVTPAELALECALGKEVLVPTPSNEGPLAFHYVLVPPTAAHRVRSIHGVSQLRNVPNVDTVSVRTSVGAPVGWRLGAASAVAAVLGTADDHKDLAQTIADIEAVEWIDYE